MEGKLIHVHMDKDGLYNGVIQTSNENKYHFFDSECKGLVIGMHLSFDMSITTRDNVDFEAINIIYN